MSGLWTHLARWRRWDAYDRHTDGLGAGIHVPIPQPLFSGLGWIFHNHWTLPPRYSPCKSVMGPLHLSEDRFHDYVPIATPLLFSRDFAYTV